MFELFTQGIHAIINSWINIFKHGINSIDTDNYNYSNGYEQDYENTKHDWENVGNDLRRSMIKYGKEKNNESNHRDLS